MIENNGFVILSKDDFGFYYSNYPENRILDSSGNQIGDSTYSGWEVVAAETINGTNKIIWKHSAGYYFYWNLDSNWQHTGGDYLSDSEILDQEILFSQDFNGDGNIGNPKVINFGDVASNINYGEYNLFSESWTLSIINALKGKPNLIADEKIKYYLHDEESWFYDNSDGVYVAENTLSLTTEEENFLNNVFTKLDPKIDADFERVTDINSALIAIYYFPENSLLLNDELVGGICYAPQKNEYEYEDRLNILVTNYPDNLSYSAYVAVHEIGHSLGLDHPQNGTDPYYADSNSTVMSYTFISGDNDPYFRNEDIESLKFIWGEENDIGFNSAAPPIQKDIGNLEKNNEKFSQLTNPSKSSFKNQKIQNINIGDSQDFQRCLVNESNALLDFFNFENQNIFNHIEISRNANLNSKIEFYKVDDIYGTVIDPVTGLKIKPGYEGYEEAALHIKNRVNELGVLFCEKERIESKKIECDLSGEIIAPFGLVEETNEIFFAFANANKDGISHFREINQFKFGFEDTFGGGDLDFNDLIFELKFDSLYY